MDNMDMDMKMQTQAISRLLCRMERWSRMLLPLLAFTFSSYLWTRHDSLSTASFTCLHALECFQ